MNMKSLAVAALAGAVAVSGACGKKPAAPAGEAGGPAAAAKFTIGMSQCNLGEPWRVQMNADVKAAAAGHPELKVVFKDAQNDTLRQRSQIEEFVGAGVDLIIVSPKEAAPLTPPVAAAVAKGIPVIVLDRARPRRRLHLLHRGGQQADRKGRRGLDRRAPGREGEGRRAQGPDDLDPRAGPQLGLPRGHPRERSGDRLRGRHEMARARRAPGDGVGPGPLPEDRPRLRPQRSRAPTARTSPPRPPGARRTSSSSGSTACPTRARST